MILPHMGAPVFKKLVFSVTFPSREEKPEHLTRSKLFSLLSRRLSDMEIIETIDHLFRCQRCFNNFRNVRKAYLGIGRPRLIIGNR